MNVREIDQIASKAKEVANTLDKVDPKMAREVFSLALSGLNNEMLDAIIDAAKSRKESISAREIYEMYENKKLNRLEKQIELLKAKRK